MKQVLMVIVLATCGAWASPVTAQCKFDAAPGDVFINEVFAQPMMAAPGKEWFEVVNLAGAERCLRGMKVVFIDGSGSSRSLIVDNDVRVSGRGGVVWFGEYLGQASSDTLAGRDTRFSLQDGDGSIELKAPDGTSLHKIEYKNAPQGQSLNFYQAYACKPPDCTQLGSEDKGSPGKPNGNSFVR